MVMEVSISGRHNGCIIGGSARHYSEEKLPKREKPKAKASHAPINPARGSKCGRSKMTEQLVKMLRRDYRHLALTYVELGRKYNITPWNARLIVLRKAWSHI